MKRLATRLLLAGALCAAATGAWAHRYHAALSDITHNEQTGNVEVIHTYMAHDVEALLQTLAKRQVDLAAPEAEALLREYVEQRFYLLGKDRSRLPLKWVGMTANVESVVVYQELAASPLASIVQVHDEVLMDLMPRQSNTVSITRSGVTASLAFDSATPQRTLK